MPDRAGIKMEWIESVVLAPEVERTQEDGRIRRWKKINAADNKYLRVVLLEDGETVHNAFFDRRFKERIRCPAGGGHLHAHAMRSVNRCKDIRKEIALHKAMCDDMCGGERWLQTYN